MKEDLVLLGHTVIGVQQVHRYTVTTSLDVYNGHRRQIVNS